MTEYFTILITIIKLYLFSGGDVANPNDATSSSAAAASAAAASARGAAATAAVVAPRIRAVVGYCCADVCGHTHTFTAAVQRAVYEHGDWVVSSCDSPQSKRSLAASRNASLSQSDRSGLGFKTVSSKKSKSGKGGKNGGYSTAKSTTAAPTGSSSSSAHSGDASGSTTGCSAMYHLDCFRRMRKHNVALFSSERAAHQLKQFGRVNGRVLAVASERDAVEKEQLGGDKSGWQGAATMWESRCYLVLPSIADDGTLLDEGGVRDARPKSHSDTSATTSASSADVPVLASLQISKFERKFVQLAQSVRCWSPRCVGCVVTSVTTKHLKKKRRGRGGRRARASAATADRGGDAEYIEETHVESTDGRLQVFF